MSSQVISINKVRYRNHGEKIPPRGTEGRDQIIQRKLQNGELVEVGKGNKKRVAPNKGKSCLKWGSKDDKIKLDKMFNELLKINSNYAEVQGKLSPLYREKSQTEEELKILGRKRKPEFVSKYNEVFEKNDKLRIEIIDLERLRGNLMEEGKKKRELIEHYLDAKVIPKLPMRKFNFV